MTTADADPKAAPDLTAVPIEAAVPEQAEHPFRRFWQDYRQSPVAVMGLAMLLVIVVNVTLRYVFGQGLIQLEELQWHLYSVGFLLGLSYAYQGSSPRWRTP